MKEIGIFYGKNTVRSAEVAKKIQKAFGEKVADIIAVEEAWSSEFEKYKYIVAGASTWFDGELPDYWDELIPEIKTLNLRNKKVAVFGLGNHIEYPDNFVDSIGILADVFKSAGAELTGFTSTAGFTYNKSLAEANGMFAGLALDLDNNADKADKQINDWVFKLKTEFK
ncbi:MAG TPA: flavodoxin [Bacteroidales bacterium]|nr:flavodoxin [Bacteroidales bacterium]HPT11859.1 flavodoxin [Bacteroidales bacterium]